MYVSKAAKRTTIKKRITVIKFWKCKGTEQGFCCINREKVTSGANASFLNVNFAADVLYMCINSHVISKRESEVFCSSKE